MKEGPVTETYELGAVVGTGTYAQVMRGHRRDTAIPLDVPSAGLSDVDTYPSVVAIKRITKSKLVTDEERSMPHREIGAHETIGRHPNAVFMYESFEDDDSVFLVLEMVEGGTLEQKLQRHPLGFPEDVARKIVYQTLLAVNHLHENSLVHGDISPKNILFDKSGDVKLCDFGMAQTPRRMSSGLSSPPCLEHSLSAESLAAASDSSSCMVGTHGYAAPELVHGFGVVDEKCDVWSMGIVAYETLTGMSPFALQGNEDRFPEQVWQGKSELAKDFTQHLLDMSPSSRPTVKQVLAHPWLRV